MVSTRGSRTDAHDPPLVEYVAAFTQHNVAAADASVNAEAASAHVTDHSEMFIGTSSVHDPIPFASIRASSASTRNRRRSCRIAFMLICVVAAIIVWASVTASLLLTQYNFTNT